MEREFSVSYSVQLSSAWGGDSAWRLLWLWKDPGRCPLVTELLRLASTGHPVLFAAFLELYVPGVHWTPIMILKAWVTQPGFSLLCQPLPATAVSTTDISCRVSWVQNHRPGFLKLLHQVVTNNRIFKVVILWPVDPKLLVAPD